VSTIYLTVISCRNIIEVKILYSLNLANADKLIKNLPETRKAIGGFFDVKKVFADHRILGKLGSLLCNRPFPVAHDIRFVNNLVYTKDYSGPDKDEIDSMPSEFEFPNDRDNRVH
jgi:hypothetical protein